MMVPSLRVRNEFRRNLIFFLSVFTFYLGVIFIFFPGLFLNFSGRVPFGNHGDVKNILGIIGFSIQTPLNQVYHLPIFYPESYMLARVHPLFGISLFFKLFQLLGLNLEQSNNLYIILSFLIGALGCYLLAREFSSFRILAVVLSSMYIIHRWNYGHLTWLNFLSRFYIPFIFLFLIRFFRTRKMRYAVVAGILSFFQFFSSVYYGVQLWAVLIPSFFLFAWLLRLLDFKGFFKAVLVFGFMLVFIIGVFYPYIFIEKPPNGEIERTAHVTAADLFSYSRVFARFWGYPENPALSLFPGFVFLFFPLFFLISGIQNGRKKFLFSFLFILLVVTMTILAFLNTAALKLIFPLFLIMVLIAAIKKWPGMTPWEKMVVLTFSFYLALFIRFEGLPFLGSFSLFEHFYRLLPITGLVNLRRVFLIILPFLIVLAVLGGERLIGIFKFRKKGQVAIICLFLAILLVLENLPFPLPILQNTLMKPLPKTDVECYQKLPFKENLVILEIPFYFKLMTRNSLYLLNWRFHRNYLLNGKASVNPPGYINDLEKIIGKYQKHFPTEPQLRELIEQYALNTIVFHWDLLSAYQKNPRVKKDIMPLIESVGRYARIDHDDDQATVVRLLENFPLDRIVRRYSSFHLRRNRVVVRLSRPYDGDVMVSLNGRLLGGKAVNGDVLELDLNRQKLDRRGNSIGLSFSEKVVLKDIALLPF